MVNQLIGQPKVSNRFDLQNFFWDNFNTLAQIGTSQKDTPNFDNEYLVFGKGADASNKGGLQKKAKRKFITQKMILELIKVVEEKGEKERLQSYWNAYHCQSNKIKSNNRIYGKYCQTRFYTSSLAICKAEIINKYLPTVEQREDPFFVTLTQTSVTAELLNKRMDEVNYIFNLIKEKYRKKHQRRKGIKFMGVQFLECNFNPLKQTYNPHLHLIVPNVEMPLLKT